MKSRAKNLRHRFGISLEQYALMLSNQKGVCAICSYAPSSDTKALAVDHSYESKEIRGLLCSWCNTGLGLLKDNPEILKKAISYLKRKPKWGKIKNERTDKIRSKLNEIPRTAK